MTEYLALEDLLALTAELGVGPVRDLGLLESAVRRPATILWGRDAYTTINEKAAALLDSVVRNHPLVDGNKRLGWLAALVFLDINGHWIEAPDATPTTWSSLSHAVDPRLRRSLRLCRNGIRRAPEGEAGQNGSGVGHLGEHGHAGHGPRGGRPAPAEGGDDGNRPGRREPLRDPGHPQPRLPQAVAAHHQGARTRPAAASRAHRPTSEPANPADPIQPGCCRRQPTH